MREVNRKCINWSKIIFSELDLDSEQAPEAWERIEKDMLTFARSVKNLGYNTVTLDDVAHLTAHPRFEAEVKERVVRIQRRFQGVIDLLKNENLSVVVTTDIVPMTESLQLEMGGDDDAVEQWFVDLITEFLEQHPAVDGVVMRLGEGDGKDVREMFHSGLFAKSAKTANRLIKRLLPLFEEKGKTLICRNWTVGAHKIGDLIWHRRTLASLLEGVDSEAFILSLKYGESDFFRYLPLNTAFFRTEVQKVIEFQARREYEGAGEFPSFVGYDVERYAKLISNAKNLVGYSVWCQTGGWHAFRRMAFLDKEAFWIEQNVAVVAAIMGEGLTVQEWIAATYPEDFQEAEFFLSLNDKVIKLGLYISEFATQKWFFRRTRIPPMLHVYWDCIFINHPVRKMMRHFVSNPNKMLLEMHEATEGVKVLRKMAERLDWRPQDLESMEDTFALVALAKEYYVADFNDELKAKIKAAKRLYKVKYPRSERQRYRLKVDYSRMRFSLRKIKLVTAFMLRKKRRYRMLDHLFTLHLLRILYRVFKKRKEKQIPDFLKDSAMGIDVLFE